MEGHYFFVAEDGERFEVQIPPFMLDDGAQRVLH
jgi:ApaG protein